jgi:hypothetical protein
MGDIVKLVAPATLTHLIKIMISNKKSAALPEKVRVHTHTEIIDSLIKLLKLGFSLFTDQENLSQYLLFVDKNMQ